jgi:glyoxylate reductase
LKKILVTRRIPDAGLDMLSSSCQVDVWSEDRPMPPEILAERVKDCDGLLSMLTDAITADLLASAPRLQVVANYAVGYNNIDVAAATKLGIAIGNTPDVLTDATADIAFALMIGAARRLGQGHTSVINGQWPEWGPQHLLGMDLSHKTLGIIGMGRIGYALARRCRLGWDMRVIYVDPNVNLKANIDLGARPVSLLQLLRESDFVSIHTDLNARTKNLIGRREFEFMKKTAIIVNTARGPIIHTPSLVEALQSGEIFAAGLDVTDPEPLPGDHPLTRLPNCLMTPHVGSGTFRSREEMAVMAANNILSAFEKIALPAWVNPDVARHPRQHAR